MSGSVFGDDRRYRMRDHGRPGRNRYLLQQAGGYSRHRRQPIYTVDHPDKLSVESLAQPENLLQVFKVLRAHGGPAPGIDGMGYHISRAEAAELARGVSRAIRSRTYRPQPTRSVRIKKDDGRFRELRLRVVVDRMVGKALYLAMKPYLENMLPTLAQDPWLVLARIEHEVIEQGRSVLVIDDVRDAFPSTPIEDVLEDHRRVTSNPNLLWLVETIIREHQQKRRTQGLDQGCPYSPAAFCIRMQNLLETPTGHDQAIPLPHRHVDNLAWTCESVTQGYQTIQATQQLLAPAGFSLKGKGGGIIDLREHGALVGHLLGFDISRSGDCLRYELGLQAWRNLEKTLLRAQEAPNPTRAAQAAIRGWITAAAPALENVGPRAVVEEVRHLAARTGLRETGSADQWIGAAHQARARWEYIRTVARQEGTRQTTSHLATRPAHPRVACDSAGSAVPPLGDSP